MNTYFTVDIISINSYDNQYLRLCRAVICGKNKDYFIILSQRLIIESRPFYQPDILISSCRKSLISNYAVNRKILITTSLFKQLKLGTRTVEIVGLYKISTQKENTNKISSKQFILVLDQIQNSSNLGAILRTAYAYGIYSIYLTTGSCYTYSAKVLNAAQVPNIFQFNFTYLSVSKMVHYLQEQSYTIVAASAKHKVSTSWKQIFRKIPKKLALIIGSEGTGISIELQKMVMYWLTIKTPIKIHSLNVAVAFGIIINTYSKENKLRNSMSQEKI